ncbi:hypothetical protein EV356DRAFT_502354 [Viridothelium virens]|uniref:RNase H type-1 domain-containing protein n=1 Tax=Viridothelium virens TaxID=1048519 RepID=A0A6A6HPC9_VIRVR|nr:hypothetical protein EV356DRAFT_502354 [Viridothelium virens]
MIKSASETAQFKENERRKAANQHFDICDSFHLQAYEPCAKRLKRRACSRKTVAVPAQRQSQGIQEHPRAADTTPKKQVKQCREKSKVGGQTKKLLSDEGRKSSAARHTADNLKTCQCHFRGTVIIQPFNKPFLTAKEADFVLRPAELNLWTGHFTVINYQNVRNCGIGIVYKTSSGLVERAYHVDQLNPPFTAGLLAVADALDIALAKIKIEEETSATEGKLHPIIEAVNILTDDASVLRLIGHASDRQIRQNAILERSFMTAYVLERMGVKAQAQWVPSHSGIRRQLRARNLALQAAGCPGMDLGGPFVT